MPEKIASLLQQVAGLPAADRIWVFGSVARQDKVPGDLDLVLDATDCATWSDVTETYGPTLRGLLGLARQHYGWLDPFVQTKRVLAVRNPDATAWVKAQKSKCLRAAIARDGKPLADVVNGGLIIQAKY